MSDNIETDFKAVAEQVNAKIKEAAAAMKEANKLAKDAGFEGLTYMYDEDRYGSPDRSEEEEEKLDEFRNLVRISPLFHEIDEAGWRTSSIGCS